MLSEADEAEEEEMTVGGYDSKQPNDNIEMKVIDRVDNDDIDMKSFRNEIAAHIRRNLFIGG